MNHKTSLANNLESPICPGMDAGWAPERASHGAFVGVSALLFAASAAVTIFWSTSMSAMGDDSGHDAAVPGPNLWRYRQAVRMTGETPLGQLTALVGLGYLIILRCQEAG
jgi:hypothetical protein